MNSVAKIFNNICFVLKPMIIIKVDFSITNTTYT